MHRTCLVVLLSAALMSTAHAEEPASTPSEASEPRGEDDAAPEAKSEEAVTEAAVTDETGAEEPTAEEPAPEAPATEETAASTEPPPAEDASPESAPAPDDTSATPTGFDSFALTPMFEGRLYGFIDSYFEQVAPTPTLSPSGQTIYENNPYEFDVLNFHVMAQGTVFSRFRYFLNLAAPGSGNPSEDTFLAVRNAWIEVPVWGTYLSIRAGKTYRRFGLYNEILDAVPTFIGIEAPELFDKDHLIVTRTTNLMVHGAFIFGDQAVSYAVMTGNDERSGFAVPLGADLSYELGTMLKVGTSFYWSGGDAAPSVGVGEGPPRGGVMPWMARDHFVVFGGYAQLTLEGFLLQVEGWQARHDAERDPDAVLKLANAKLNPRQAERFGLVTAAGPEDVVTEADYEVNTAYARLGYSFSWEMSGLEDPIEITPYAQLDWYQNPEAIADKDFGGDNEAGLSDDGQFTKATVGAVLRPVPAVALKVDGSTHMQMFNGELVMYPEIRASLSATWELGGGR